MLPRLFLLLLVSAAAGFAATTQIAPDKPIVNFRLPDFTPEGNRAWLVRGSEARFVNAAQVDIKELNLTLFTGQADGKIETLILSPSAQVRVKDMLARGSESIRVINDNFEATGEDWSYLHKEKRVSIGRNVRVVLHTQLNDILK
jgi:hypothetical protein